MTIQKFQIHIPDSKLEEHSSTNTWWTNQHKDSYWERGVKKDYLRRLLIIGRMVMTGMLSKKN